MNKQEYLGQLRAALACLPEDEIAESVAFYEEMIDDRVADGLTEEDVVASLDDPKVAARTIIAGVSTLLATTVLESGASAASPTTVAPTTVAPAKQKNRVLYWTLIILGSPLWLTLLIAAALVVLAAVLTVWILVLALWALAVGLLAGGPLGIAVCWWALFAGQPAYGVFELGSGLLCFGLGVFCLHGAVVVTRKLARASRRWGARAAALFSEKWPWNAAARAKEAPYEA